MALAKLLLPAVALAPLVLGHPSGSALSRRHEHLHKIVLPEGGSTYHVKLHPVQEDGSQPPPEVRVQASNDDGSQSHPEVHVEAFNNDDDSAPIKVYMSERPPPSGQDAPAEDSVKEPPPPPPAVDAQAKEPRPAPSAAEASKYEALKDDAPEPKASEDLKTEEPKTENPKTENPKTEAPKTGAPAEDMSPADKSDVSVDKSGAGITYDPYLPGRKSKSADEIARDFKIMADNGYRQVRIYGTDHGCFDTIRDSAKRHDMKLLLGVFDIDQVEKEVAVINKAFSNHWNQVVAVGVGNELVEQHGASVIDKLETAAKAARDALGDAGYKGKIVLPDTFQAYIKYPKLGEASDWLAINAHPFFDATSSAEKAGSWLQKTVSQVQAKHPSKDVVVTETGWPSQGSANGEAAPSQENQKAAIESIKQAFAGSKVVIFFFSAFDRPWIGNGGKFGTEQYSGILSKAKSGAADAA